MRSIAVFGYSRLTRACVEALIRLGYRVRLFCPRGDRGLFDGLMTDLSAPVAYFEDMDGEELAEAMEAFQPDYLLSIIFNHHIPDHVLARPRFGAMNVHPAPLPAFRTANAWFWPLRCGVTRSEVVVHHMTREWDRGNILVRVPFKLHPAETQGTYTAKVTAHAATVMGRLDPLLRSPPLPEGEPQGEGRYYPAVKLLDLFIDFEDGAASAEALVRACNPQHGAQAIFRETNIEVAEAAFAEGEPDAPGTIRIRDGRPLVSCADGLLELRVLKDPYEGVFSGERFVRFYRVEDGEMLYYISALGDDERLKGLVG